MQLIQVMNPDIRIADDGKSAKGEWLLFQVCFLWPSRSH